MSSDPASSVPLPDIQATAMMPAYGQILSSAQRPISRGLNIPMVPMVPVDQDLVSDFSMTDLNEIHGHLWIAGSYGNINTLHHQGVLLRNIIPSELSRLHLVWFDRTIYIKPLPDCLLNASSYSYKDTDPSGFIVGFLRSYCRLIQFPVDFAIAKKTDLMSKDATWEQWVTVRKKILIETEDSHLNRRYEYGELRLNRLDVIYRLTGRGLTYFTVHRTYKTWLAGYFSLFATVFALVAIVLTATQVLVVIPGIPETLAVVSYRFPVAVLVGVCLYFGYVLSVFLFMFLYNLVLARAAHRRLKASAS